MADALIVVMATLMVRLLADLRSRSILPMFQNWLWLAIARTLLRVVPYASIPFVDGAILLLMGICLLEVLLYLPPWITLKERVRVLTIAAILAFLAMFIMGNYTVVQKVHNPGFVLIRQYIIVALAVVSGCLSASFWRRPSGRRPVYEYHAWLLTAWLWNSAIIGLIATTYPLRLAIVYRSAACILLLLWILALTSARAEYSAAQLAVDPPRSP